ncbi:MAG: ATP-binding cassette domain-containing protein [Planctomycetota bacterium]|nr:ATP-binding cassette domain-containing protein [Planctomycetota bacterium]
MRQRKFGKITKHRRPYLREKGREKREKRKAILFFASGNKIGGGIRRFFGKGFYMAEMNIGFRHAPREHAQREHARRGAANAYPFNLSLAAGEITAVVGADRAWQTALAAALTGDPSAFSATLTLNGKTLTPRSPREALALGVVALRPEPLIFPSLTAAENIRAFLPKAPPLAACAALWRELSADSFPAKTPAAALSLADRRRLELIRARLIAPQLLIIDEGLTAFAPADATRIFDFCRPIPTRVLLLTAAPSAVLGADNFYAADADNLSAKTPATPANIDQLTARLYPAAAAAKMGKTVLEILGLQIRRAANALSLTARRGEILGITGLAGQGGEDLWRVLSGAQKAVKGVLSVDGKNLRLARVSRAALVKAGIVEFTGNFSDEASVPAAEVYLFRDDERGGGGREIMTRLAADGKAVVYFSANFDRQLRWTQTLAVFHHGALLPPRATDKWTFAELTAAAASGKTGLASLL